MEQLVHDLSSDWSEKANPNGAWSLRAGDVDVPTHFEDRDGIPGQSAWALTSGGGGHVPAFMRIEVDDPTWDDAEVGDVVVHSQDDSSAPENGQAHRPGRRDPRSTPSAGPSRPR